ncbi:metallophosphoesterase [uncultured Arcanobacterium sp.]|uniref:metallophosphoesterase n=1 Tax=uncultured Arcanobacterium sp. TaxID=487520 RepID=UPI002628DEEB|nr:metallophosphoesterase [uncultured Arcanobacterium sp.]
MNTKKLFLAGAGLAASGCLTAGAAYIHGRSYRLYRRTIFPATPAPLPTHAATKADYPPASEDYAPLRILHISDLHLTKCRYAQLRFLMQAAHTHPDLLVFTGDLISQAAVLPELARALESFAGIPGVFVYGSNDYTAPRFKNPFRYLYRTSSADALKQHSARPLPTEQLTSLLESFGWINLNNARAEMTIKGRKIDFIGVDDPHIKRDIFPAATPVATPAAAATLGGHGEYRAPNIPTALDAPSEHGEPAAQNSPDTQGTPAVQNRDLRIGLTHAPYLRILKKLAENDCQLIFAGHTHGGQVCLPGGKALTTNCDIPTPYASGIFTWPLGAPAQKGDAQLTFPQAKQHAIVEVSAGLGSSPFVPLRTFCPPELILLEVY